MNKVLETFNNVISTQVNIFSKRNRLIDKQDLYQEAILCILQLPVDQLDQSYVSKIIYYHLLDFCTVKQSLLKTNKKAYKTTTIVVEPLINDPRIDVPEEKNDLLNYLEKNLSESEYNMLLLFLHSSGIPEVATKLDVTYDVARYRLNVLFEKLRNDNELSKYRS